MGAQQQGKEEGSGIGFGKSYFSRFILSISQELAFCIIFASIMTLSTLILA
jgi:hypothetical protein